MATDIRSTLQTLICYLGDPEDWQSPCSCFGDPSGIRDAIADANAALDAAASVRAEAGTTAGPIPEAGASQNRNPSPDFLARIESMLAVHRRRSTSRDEDVAREIASLFSTPSPQPPAPAEGAPDVAGLVERLSRYADEAKYVLTVDVAAAAADALSAQAEFIRRLRRHADVLREQHEGDVATLTAQAAEIAEANEQIAATERAGIAMAKEVDRLTAALAAKEAEIAYLLDDYVHWLDARHARGKAHSPIRSALTGKPKEGR